MADKLPFDLSWRQKYARNLRTKEDINSVDSSLETSVSDDVIFDLAKKQIPLVFKSNLIEARLLARKRAMLDRFARYFLKKKKKLFFCQA